ncbi:hypothetical protein [Photobacterium galatheae]|uniref:hypothetical protein n=1 Tax=Photobacterium galatheae TaxID=1654360 RepID=UPI00202D043A|nr:hypothetical protein [Photobacterium galatheae]
MVKAGKSTRPEKRPDAKPEAAKSKMNPVQAKPVRQEKSGHPQKPANQEKSASQEKRRAVQPTATRPSKAPVAVALLALVCALGFGGTSLYLSLSRQLNDSDHLVQRVEALTMKSERFALELGETKQKLSDVLQKNTDLSSLLAVTALEAEENAGKYVVESDLMALKSQVEEMSVVAGGFAALLDRMSSLEAQTEQQIESIVMATAAQMKEGLNSYSKSTNKWVTEQLDRRGDLMIRQIGNVVAEVKIDSERQQRETIKLKTELDHLKSFQSDLKALNARLQQLEKDVDVNELRQLTYKMESLLTRMNASGIQ